ncbi:hypothetical protein RHMOL_Rhmol06G0049400 [Rhododendron molle]|uniref:Uncharacterized protein n=1 Tax=Rhododendron molle TaxID=49168 RepID=A0ACC0NAT4_RHOML|nr:hypothetical protein RHMOL_Rhmol06G0049400 [Rhododendron molle]
MRPTRRRFAKPRVSGTRVFNRCQQSSFPSPQNTVSNPQIPTQWEALSSSMATPISATTPSSTQSSTAISERRRDDDPIIHPERPGKAVCPIYKHHGRCNFGASCILDHPKDLQPMEPKKRKRGEKKPRLNLRGFTFEQKQAHFKRVKETDGFHVGYVPLGSRLGGMICPVPLSQCGSGEKNLAKLAIKGYNEEYISAFFWAQHTIVKLIRVNFSAVGGVLNFITFQAKDWKPGSRPQNFQTRVYQCTEKTEVQFCRLEQKKSTRPEGPGETSQQPGQ